MMRLGQPAYGSIELEALYTSSPDDDFRELQPACLDKFIAEQLQPDDDFRTLVSTALHTLYLYLQENMRPPTVKRLIKGGSMGKGTALKGKSDLDCVLVMNGVIDARELKEEIGGILAQLRGLLETDPLSGWRITIIRVNTFMVQISMYSSQWKESVEVDILPTFDADAKNEYFRSQLYDSMAGYDYDTQQFCSAALAELQRDFIKQRPAKLKNLIRLVKHWCKTYLPWEYPQPRLPNSYLLELLTIDVWEKAGSPDRFTTARLFNNVMEALCDHSQLDITWDKYYSTFMIQSGSPRIMDPANPYQNVYNVVQDWERVRRIAKKTLMMPLLQNYRSSFFIAESSRCANCCGESLLLQNYNASDLDTENSRSSKCFIILSFIVLAIVLFLIYSYLNIKQ